MAQQEAQPAQLERLRRGFDKLAEVDRYLRIDFCDLGDTPPAERYRLAAWSSPQSWADFRMYAEAAVRLLGLTEEGISDPVTCFLAWVYRQVPELEDLKAGPYLLGGSTISNAAHAASMALFRAQSSGAAGQPAKKPVRRKRRRQRKELTARQLEAAQIVAECKGNKAEAARQMGLDRKTVAEHYKKAMKIMRSHVTKPQTTALPQDHRGQSDVAGHDEGPAGPTVRTRVRKDRRR